jgi:hypothetical protein
MMRGDRKGLNGSIFVSLLGIVMPHDSVGLWVAWEKGGRAIFTSFGDVYYFHAYYRVGPGNKIYVARLCCGGNLERNIPLSYCCFMYIANKKFLTFNHYVRYVTATMDNWQPSMWPVLFSERKWNELPPHVRIFFYITRHHPIRMLTYESWDEMSLRTRLKMRWGLEIVDDIEQKIKTAMDRRVVEDGFETIEIFHNFWDDSTYAYPVKPFSDIPHAQIITDHPNSAVLAICTLLKAPGNELPLDDYTWTRRFVDEMCDRGYFSTFEKDGRLMIRLNN